LTVPVGCVAGCEAGASCAPTRAVEKISPSAQIAADNVHHRIKEFIPNPPRMLIVPADQFTPIVALYKAKDP
jgi:hypothetical protein